MSSIRLTDSRIKALKPGESARDIRETTPKGFGVRVLPSGRKRFFIHTQIDGKRFWKIIGDPNEMRFAEAYERATVVLAAVWNGQPSVGLPEETVFEAVARQVFHRYVRNWKPGTLKVNRGYYRKQILPWFKGRQIAEVTRRDVQDRLSSLHETPVAADRSAPILSVIMDQAEIYG
ncbi:MAG: integrase arm-type DNA-binding domain-containing protein [Paracoccaceae bacterium]|nr:integrase arm-type DNA-binding domain-containing protein [Paracoccaceae bacterium]MDE2913536.1 integrase arm-type DNA-binding domain-containing protein [Paracoccaceae bacterium]